MGTEARETLDTDPAYCVRGPLPAPCIGSLRPEIPSPGTGLVAGGTVTCNHVCRWHSRSLPPMGARTGQFSPSCPSIKYFPESLKKLPTDSKHFIKKHFTLNNFQSYNFFHLANMLRVWAFKEKQGSITETKQALATQDAHIRSGECQKFSIIKQETYPRSQCWSREKCLKTITTRNSETCIMLMARSFF